MPMLDMPLKELQAYQGISPCPNDIDDYWDRAIAEMKATDPQVSLTHASFQTQNAECYDLYFTGVGGARVYAKYLRPRNIKEPIPAVLQFHGYTGSSGYWAEKLNYVNAGFAVAALDCRGQGGLSQDINSVTGNTFRGHIIRGLAEGPESLLFRKIFLDTAQLANIVMSFEEVDEDRVAAMGMSQGGALTLACASLEPKIKRLAPACPFLCDYKRVWEMDLAKIAYEELSTYFRQFDPLHEKEEEIFHTLGYIDVQNLVKRIKGKVLWAIGLMDDICPPSTQFAAYNKITSEKKMKIYPDFKHEGYPWFDDEAYMFMEEMARK